MKHLFTIKLYFLYIIAVHSQSAVVYNESSLIANWSKGDIFGFEITKVNKQWANDVIGQNDSVTYIAKFEVIDSSETGFKVNWKLPKNYFGILHVPDSLIGFFSDYEIGNIRYSTNFNGNYIGVDNWEEISSKLIEITDDFTNLMNSKYLVNNELFLSTMRAIKSVYQSKEGIDLMLFKELTYFHFAYGIEYSSELHQYVEELPNAFGGNPIRGNTKLQMVNFSKEDKNCRIIQEMSLNEADTKELMENFVSNAGLNDVEMKEVLELANYSIDDFNEYEINYEYTIPNNINTERIIDITAMDERVKRIERIKIRRLE